MNWFFITRLGGLYVTLAAAIGIAGWLCAARAWRPALLWCVLLCGLLVLTAATKILFIGWGLGIEAIDFTGISGHALRATLIYPVLLYLAMRKATPSWRFFSVLAGLLLGTLVAVSRVKLHAHSMSEVVAGCVLGISAGAIFLHMFKQPQVFVVDRTVIAGSFIGLLAATFLPPAPTERWMISSALYISSHDRPYIRKGWTLAPRGWHHRQGASAKPSATTPPRPKVCGEKSEQVRSESEVPSHC